MLRIAHISDLHISKLDTADESNLQWLAKLLGNRLKINIVADKHNEDKLNALKTALAPLHPDVIVVTGDITNFGDGKSFDEAAKILAELKGLTGAKRIICVPGNHDSLCERVADLRRRNIFSRAVVWLLARLNQVVAVTAHEAAKLEDSNTMALLNNYRRFSTGRYDDVDPKNPVFIETSWGEVAFFLFNSTNDKGIMANEGRIGAKQYDALNQAMNDDTKKLRIAAALRIALLHHHPITVPDIEADAVERGYNWMTDGVLFVEYLGKRLGQGRNFHFILHGHQHVPYVFRNAPGLNAHIVAAGSALAGNDSHHGSFNVIDLISPFEARVRRFDYSLTGYEENLAKREDSLPVRPIESVRSPNNGSDYPPTGEDIAIRGTVEGREEAYDADRAYDLLEYNVTVTPSQNYIGVYRRKGKVVTDKTDEGIVFLINGNPPKSFQAIGVTARGTSSRYPDEAPLEIESISDKRTQIMFRVRHKAELRRGDKFDISMKFNWQSSQDFPVHFDGLNLLYFSHPVGRLVYRAYLPWEPSNPKVIAEGITEGNVELAESGITPQQDGTYLYHFEINNPKRLVYVISFGPRPLR